MKLISPNQPQIMGVLNVTPDSFSDGGRYITTDQALRRAETMLVEGVDIIDIGGESTRPGAKTVGTQEELDRVIPVIEAIRLKFPVTISIDTRKAEVMAAAIKAGANLVNDVTALADKSAIKVMKENPETLLCLMHMKGEPSTMQMKPEYRNVVNEVFSFLSQRVNECVELGLNRKNLIIDPGFGFGKTLAHNLDLMKNLSKFTAIGVPLLVGVSRKSMIAGIIEDNEADRLPAGLALATLAVSKGASIIRTHDVAETKQVLKVCQALRGG